MRLRKVSTDSPGLTRRRAGGGFVYLAPDGTRVTEPEVLDRCRSLAIPPAWREVWICPDPRGHIQAVGTDDAGRRQYLYHAVWRERRGRAKYRHVRAMARGLPAARERVTADLALSGMPRARALAVAFRLLDRGAFRVGGEQYAAQHSSFGLATLRKRHLRLARDGTLVFTYRAKSGQPRQLALVDEELRRPLGTLRRRRGGGGELLAYQQEGRWRDVSSADINTYLKELLGPEVTAKDFRTWYGTVVAAAFLGQAPEARTARQRQAVLREAVAAVAAELGNTAAVSRASYIDPLLVDCYERGERITVPVAGQEPAAWTAATRHRIDQAVLELLPDA